VEEEQLRRLNRSRIVATGMLAIAAAIFAVSLTAPSPNAWLLLVRSVAEAALVGGLADWFAVTALFRRPLRLPIPHTAIVPANKDRIGEGLARFLDRNFLTRDLLIPELRALRVADRLAGRALGAQLRNASLGPLAAQIVRILTAAGYHEAVLDSALDYARDFLTRNEEQLLEAVTERRRRWIPRAINREIARAMLRAAGDLIDDLRKPDGAARQGLLAAIDELAEELANSERPSGHDGARVLRQPELQAWIATSWDKGRDLMLADLAAPSSRVRRALALAIASVGETLRADPGMRERLDAALEAMLAEALPWRGELIRVVAEVVRKWEPRAFSDRIELAVGADLQYIRMNGTIVGGLVGGGLYLLSLLAG
jgi:uncharacterized membrane-anchored protein YjiN (DUF445 family)